MNQIFYKKGFCFLISDEKKKTEPDDPAILLKQGYSIDIKQPKDIYVQKTLSGDFCVSDFGPHVVQITIRALGTSNEPPQGCASIGGSLDALYRKYVLGQKTEDTKYTLIYDGVTYNCYMTYMQKQNDTEYSGQIIYTFILIGTRT